MKTAQVSLCLAILIFCGASSPAMAQQPPGSFGGWPEETSPGVDDIHTRSIWDHRNFMLRTDAGDGVGYIRGYQTFAAFQPITIEPEEFILWMSPRGFVTFNSGNFGGNLGAGFRWLNKDTNRIFGGGAWWDHDNNGTNTYDQLGGSLEWLGKYFDLRANAYIPTNQNVHMISQYLNNNNVFINNNIGVGQTTITNTALRGGDFEGGGALPGIGDLGLRTYAGGYYYQGPTSGGGIYGVRARLEALVTQDMWGTVIWQHDRVFGTTVSGAATFYLFTGNEQQWFRRIDMETRLYQQQERQYRVAVQENVANDVLLALRNGGTGGSGGAVGTPIYVLHVDNTAASGGDGSVEHPLNFLPTSTGSNVDIVFVHSGNGTSTNMNHGIVLNDYQRLLGQGVPHVFTDTLGTFALPGYTPGQTIPSITNTTPGGNAVTLASHNEVSGFNIAFNIPGQTNQGIAGSFITDFNINNVNITGAGNSTIVPVNGAAVQLINATGTGLITKSTFNNNTNADGVLVNNSFGGTLNLTMSNVQANNNLNGIDLIASASTINPVVSNLTANNNAQDGITSTLTAGASMTGTFDKVTASNNNNLLGTSTTFGNGFIYNSDASTGDITITRSTFDSNLLNGVSFTTANNSTLTAALINNTPNPTSGTTPGIFGNGTNGVEFNNKDSQVTATLLNNTISSNGGFGIGVTSQGTGAFATSFTLNAGGYLTQDLNHNGQLDPGEDNFAIASLGPSIIGNGILDREGNTLVANQGAGISFLLLDQGTGTANIIGNTIQQTSAGTGTYVGQGIDLQLNGSTAAMTSANPSLTGTVDKNTIGSLTTAGDGNAGDGIRVSAFFNSSIQGLNIGTTGQGNVIANNGGDGIDIERLNTAQVGNVTPVSIVDNNITLNQQDGVRIAALGSYNSITNGFVLNNNKITSNVNNGVHLHVEADANMDVNMAANTIQSNTLNGVLTDETIGTPGDLRGIGGTWVQNKITNNGNDGIQLNAFNGSFATPTLTIGSTTTSTDGNIIQNNAGQGIQISSSGNVTMGYNNIFKNAAGGIYTNTSGQTNFVITQNNIVQNGTQGTPTDGGDGIQMLNSAQAGSTISISNNNIMYNAGRGLNLWNAGDGVMDATVQNNLIQGNGWEGVMVVNTASVGSLATQANAVTSPSTMAATGAVDTAPKMTLTFDSNTVEGNGILNGITNPFGAANGLTILVGTSDGGRSFLDDGGFASSGRGGIVATVTNNTFSGNLGADVYIQSFTSTVNPATTGGTWSDTVFTPTGYQSDPLARLDLVFHNNTGDELSVNHNGALYSNAEAVFKTRDTAQTDPGPFAVGQIDRNAQRQGGRFGLPPGTPGGLSNAFLYSGIGESTFRLLNASSVPAGATTLADALGTGFTITNGGFLRDASPYLGPGSANGLPVPVTVTAPFGWTFP